MAGNLGKPTKPRWADGAPAYTAEPSLAKRILGWLSQEKPPFQWMNWLFKKNKEWHDFKERFLDIDQSLLMRSDATVTWTGAQLTFTQDLEMIFKVGGDIWTNTIALADSPLALADGDVVVLIKDDANTALALEGVYANIGVGEYCIEPEVNLTENTDEHELILFRRRGAVLEIPMQRRSINTGAIFELNMSDISSGGIMPIGSYLIFDDFNGTLPLPDTTPYWWPCDGTAVNSVTSSLHGINTKDVTGRYLVGYTTGVEGDGSINTAGAMGIIGNAGHNVNLVAHEHTMGTHTHTMGTHIHTMGTHTHGVGTFQFKTMETDASFLYGYAVGGGALQIDVEDQSAAGVGGRSKKNLTARQFYTKDGTGTVAAVDPGDTNATDPGDTNARDPGDTTGFAAGPYTQDIQPRSVEVRCYVRIL